jgi:fibronectin type 3 domain-containing protein
MSHNKIGFFVHYGEYNIIMENTIAHSTDTGIIMDIPFHENYLIHNYLISNKKQAKDYNPVSVNYWCDRYLGGNYWDDYKGKDNGKFYRIVGDGIGDEGVPHWRLDWLPYIEPGGWLKPGNPILFDPGEISTDGNYVLFWNSTARTDKYILEESTAANFSEPVVVFSGKNYTKQFHEKPNGTYYYRLKTVYKDKESPWSKIVDIIVDHPPSMPLDLTVIEATGHEIYLKWEPNPEDDIVGYNIYVNDTFRNGSGPFHLLETVPPDTTAYAATGLGSERTYYFKICAYDYVPNFSNFSNTVQIATKDVTSPAAPVINTAMAVSGTEIYVSWEPNTDKDLEGYALYLTDPYSGGSYNLYKKLNATVTSINITGLSEKTTYYFKLLAFDEVPNNSPFSDAGSVSTPDETPPVPPSGLVVSVSTSSYNVLEWAENPEPDVIGYKIYRSFYKSDYYRLLNYELLTEPFFVDINLDENTRYYYRVRAVDDVGWESYLSEFALGTTEMGPHPPFIKNPVKEIEMLEDSHDNHTINLMDWFADPNEEDILKFRFDGQKYLSVEIDELSGQVTLIPQPNWCGWEILTFYATDGIFKEISDSVTIHVVEVNDPPEGLVIRHPRDNRIITNEDWLNFEARCTDPELVYGDELTFKWTSSVSSKIGIGEEIKREKLEPGEHVITLYVIDRDGLTESATINITVLDIEAIRNAETQDDESKLSLLAIGIIVTVIAVIIVSTIFVYTWQRNKRRNKRIMKEIVVKKVMRKPRKKPHGIL